MAHKEKHGARRYKEISVGKDYKLLGKKLGKGSFGSIYLGKDKDEQEVAIKLEMKKTNTPQVLYESKLLQTLQGGVGIPKVYYSGREGNYNVMIMERLGPTLETLYKHCNRSFSLKTVVSIAIEMMSRIEFVHNHNLIHRDIKPDNFLLGIGEHANEIFIIDFGLAKYYKDPETDTHITYRENKALTGTARYASMFTHLGLEQSRRDDLESIGYVIIYFLKNGLPWQGITTGTKEAKYQAIGDKKMSLTVEQLCVDIPPELAIYLNYVKNLRFNQTPDYSYLNSLFLAIAEREGFTCDGTFDWTNTWEQR